MLFVLHFLLILLMVINLGFVLLPSQQRLNRPCLSYWCTAYEWDQDRTEPPFLAQLSDVQVLCTSIRE